RAEVHADPDPALLVLHQVHVMVARTDGAELRRRQLRELALRRKVGVADAIEHLVVGSLGRGHTHAERDPPRDLVHDRLDTATGVEVVARQLRPRRLVAAADVVADARRRDVALVGDAAADRLAVAGVVVGTEDAELGVAGLHAPLQLVEASLVDGSERLDRAHLSLLSLSSWTHTTVTSPMRGGGHPLGSPFGKTRCQSPREESNLCARVRSPLLFQ